MNIKCISIIILCVLFFFPIITSAQVLTGRFSSSFYAWEQQDTLRSSNLFVRGFQTAQLNFSKDNVSFQTSFYGSSLLLNSFGDNGIARVSNMFLRWKNIGGAVDVSLGRVPVFAGVGNGTVDGGLLKARAMNNKLTMVAYGGANVKPELKSSGFTDLDKNFFLGGQIIGRVLNESRVGISYMNRNIMRESYLTIRPDSLFNPMTVLIVPESKAEQIIGADARINESKLVTCYARYDYDMNSKRSLRGQLSTRWTANEQFAFTADYIYREPRILYNSFLMMFPFSSVKEYEGGVEYTLKSDLRLYGKYAYVQYTDDKTQRFSLGINTENISLSYTGTNGYAGEQTSLYGQVMYPMLERMLIPTVGLSYANYQLDTYASATQDVFAASLGAVVRSNQSWSADMQLQWLNNPVAQNDVRLFGKLSYWFNHTFGQTEGKESAQ
ncbi:MAG: hypothetical protein HYZ33_02045 [Ignavibacteriales bacterium]|nr:hypothetical protein [Ignavibacteriales bacterium]